MAHLIGLETPAKGRNNRIKFPSLTGRFGFSLYIGMKELFIGIVFSDTILESVTRRRVAKISKGTVRTFGFDPLA